MMLHMMPLALVLSATEPLRSDLPTIARKYAERIGAPASLPAVRPVRLRWHIRRFGLEGTMASELGRSRGRIHAETPPLSETTIIDQERVVRQEVNGQVTDVGGLDRADALSTLSIDTGAWLLDATKLEQMPPDDQGRPRLRLDLPAPVELTFSSEGDLEKRRVMRGDEAEETEYSDWGTVGGRRLSRHVVVHERNIVEPIEMSLTRVEPLPEKAAFPLPTAREDVHLPAGVDRIELPLSLIHDRWLLASVDIGGRSALFLVDTGASSTVIDDTFATELGLAFSGKLTQKAGLFPVFRFVRTKEARVGGARVDPQTIVAVDMAHSPLGTFFPGVLGILGFDFLSRFVFVVDYPASRLSFVRRSAFRPQPDDAPIPCTLDGTDAVVDAKVGGESARFLVDTGSGGGILVMHVAGQKALVSADASRFYDPEGTHFGSGAPAGTWPARADFTLGPFVWHRAPMAVLDEGTAKGSSFEQGGNIGAGYLRHFRMSVDLAGGRLWLAQGIPFRDRPLATYGLQLDRRQGRIVVRSVAVDGPATRSGLKKGDEVISVNGLGGGGGRFLERALENPGAGELLELVVRRDEHERDVELRAEPLPGGKN
jgi:hypothetical protein